MTIDERLDRLTGVVETLAASATVRSVRLKSLLDSLHILLPEPGGNC